MSNESNALEAIAERLMTQNFLLCCISVELGMLVLALVTK